VHIPLRRAAPQQQAATAVEGAAVSLSGLHLLIAEDVELNAEILADLLEMEGMTSEWAENGRRAVEMFEGSAPGHFYAILMDMRMPVMDGLAATRAIRALQRPDAAVIPIIALTANAFEEDVRQCLQAGMNAHLSKPVEMDQLKAALGRLHAGQAGGDPQSPGL
jgi:CheY-like chemotaxis protein